MPARPVSDTESKREFRLEILFGRLEIEPRARSESNWIVSATEVA
jgi:hypothetical protein